MLVVIAIVAVLASILFSVIGKVQDRARKVSAVSDIRNVRVAILSYYNDYHKYPLNELQYNAGVLYNLGDTVYGDPGPNPGQNPRYGSADLFNILRGIADDRNNQDNKLNPSQTPYWGGGYAKNAAAPRSGIAPQDATLPNGNKIEQGALVDPWGNSYVVFIDADNNGDMTQVLGYFYSEYKYGVSTYTPGSPPFGVAICSLGPDGVFGSKVNGQSDGRLTGSDDIVSWQ